MQVRKTGRCDLRIVIAAQISRAPATDLLFSCLAGEADVKLRNIYSSCFFLFLELATTKHLVIVNVFANQLNLTKQLINLYFLKYYFRADSKL